MWVACGASLHACCLVVQYAKIVQKLGFPATFKEFKIQNIVGSCDVKFPIRLEGLAYAHSLFASVSSGRCFGVHGGRIFAGLVRLELPDEAI